MKRAFLAAAVVASGTVFFALPAGAGNLATDYSYLANQGYGTPQNLGTDISIFAGADYASGLDAAADINVSELVCKEQGYQACTLKVRSWSSCPADIVGPCHRPSIYGYSKSPASAIAMPATSGLEYFALFKVATSSGSGDTGGSGSSTPTTPVAASTVPMLTLDVSPPNQRPYGTVLVTPLSTLLDLTTATIALSVNGKAVYSGNAAPVPVTLLGPGSPTTIKAVATIGSKSYTASVMLTPGDVSIVAEPVSSAPALYAGKPAIADGGSVRIVAITDFESAPGKILAPSALSYVWKIGDTTLENSSGLGKSAIIVASPLQYRDQRISLKVSDVSGAVLGSDSLVLSSAAPTLRLYEEDPLQGTLYDRALGGSYTLTSSEVSLTAAPYSFPLDSGAPSVNWFLNGETAQAGSNITLRPTGTGSGAASISATAAGSDSALSAGASVSISFGSSVARSFFGL